MTAETEIRHRIDNLKCKVEPRKKEIEALDKGVADAQKASDIAESESTRLAKELEEAKMQVEVVEKEVQSLQNGLETRKRRIDVLRAELERETNRICFMVSSGR